MWGLLDSLRGDKENVIDRGFGAQSHTIKPSYRTGRNTDRLKLSSLHASSLMMCGGGCREGKNGRDGRWLEGG